MPRAARSFPSHSISRSHFGPIITETGLTSSFSDTNATSYATASITPTGNQLVLAAVISSVTASGPPNAPTLSGNGLTWVQVATVTWNTTALPLSRLTVFRSLGGAPSTGAVTIDFAGQTQSECLWSVTQYAHVDTSGTNGSGAVVQSGTNRADTATSLTVALSAISNASNAGWAAFGTNLGSTQTAKPGFAKLDEQTSAVPATDLMTEWRYVGDDPNPLSTFSTRRPPLSSRVSASLERWPPLHRPWWRNRHRQPSRPA